MNLNILIFKNWKILESLKIGVLYILLFIYVYYNFFYQDSYIFLYLYLFDWFILIFSYILIYFIGLNGFFIINLFSFFLFFLFYIIKFNSFIFYNLQILLIQSTSVLFNNETSVYFVFYYDYLNYSFGLLTSTIALFIFIYAFSYMRNEPQIILFLFFLKSFILSMLLLLFAGNWITLLLGWELIGVSSFLLINFWTTKITTLKSAFKAFIFNKYSDCCLLIALLISNNLLGVFLFNSKIFLNFWNYYYIYIFNTYINISSIFLLCLIMAAFCKSAQFGFHIWLPDSMEAPVPASALIHSATLVSAGIYLLLRFNYLFDLSNLLTNFFLIITSFTCFYGALIASFQTDIKKTLAYSTISHCGMLCVSIIYFNPWITLLYLFGHGFFKSLSFAIAGNLIQFNNNYQDIQVWGNNSFFLKFELFIFFIAIFNLASFPFFLNFFCKHFLLINVNINSFIAFLSINFMFLTAFCGIFYSSRLFFYTFFNFKKNHFSFFLIKVLNLKNLNLKKYLSKSNWLSIFSTLCLLTLSIVLLLYFYTLFYNNLINLFDLNITYYSNFLKNFYNLYWQELFFKIFILVFLNWFYFRYKNIFFFNFLIYYLIFILII